MAENQPTETRPAPQAAPVGRTFGRWTVIGPAPPTPAKRWGIYWRCRCSCAAATERDVAARNLMAGRSKGCDCLTRESATKHGGARRVHRHPLYPIWSSMLARCLNPKNKVYHNYGGRGITVCERWRAEDGLASFATDMGPRPSLKHSVDRIDNDGPYSPDNCRWATTKEQGRNIRLQRTFTCNGKTQCLAAWAEELGANHSMISARLAAGWPLERALTQPSRAARRKPITPDLQSPPPPP